MLVAQALGSAQAPSAAPGSAPDVYSNTVRYARGQSVQPVFEGWSRNPDGSFDMWFGYLNRNYEERLNVRVGSDNGFNGEDMGQPEFFEPRRQQFAFKINVPSTFPKDRDLVWTVKANGVTQRAYGSLWPVWEIDQHTISANRGSRTAVDFDEPPNEAPRVVDAPQGATTEVGKALTLAVSIADDGNPKPRADRGARVAGIKTPANRTRRATAEPVAPCELDSVARARHRRFRSPRRPRGGRARHHQRHLRQAGRVHPPRLCRGRQHPHAIRRQGHGRCAHESERVRKRPVEVMIAPLLHVSRRFQPSILE